MSPDTGLLTSWPEGGPTLLWTISDIGERAAGYASITIQNGRLFTTGNRAGRSVVFCFDLDGNKLWSYENGPAWTRNDPGTRSTPAVDGDFVYDLTPYGYLVCLNVETGERVWGRNILTEFEGENLAWGLAGSLRIDGDRLYAAPGGARASLVAFDKRTGDIIWTTPSLGQGYRAGYGTPTVFEHDGLRIVAITYSRGMFGVNAENGELLFRFRHEHQFEVNATGPLYHDGYLFLSNDWRDYRGGMGGSIKLRLTITDGNVSLEEVWRNLNFDPSQDNVILLDGLLFGSTHIRRGGAFLCVDWNTGETLYEGARVGRGAPLTWAEGLLYVVSTGGDVRLIRPNPERFDVISEFSLPRNGAGGVLAHPVVIGQRLYIRHGTFLYCFDIAR